MLPLPLGPMSRAEDPTMPKQVFMASKSFRPSKGFALHKLTEQDVMETYEIRPAIEGYCARKLALDHSSKSARKLLVELRGSLEKLQVIFEKEPGVELFADEDQNFRIADFFQRFV